MDWDWPHRQGGGSGPDVTQPSGYELALTDDSSAVDLSDAVFGLSCLFLGGLAPPAPGPVDCGPDPSADALDCAAYTRIAAPRTEQPGGRGCSWRGSPHRS